jgi:hypothetical protein
VIEAAASTDVVVLSLSDEQIAETKRSKLVIPAGTYAGQDCRHHHHLAAGGGLHHHRDERRCRLSADQDLLGKQGCDGRRRALVEGRRRGADVQHHTASFIRARSAITPKPGSS